jgi:hypothetical protein
VKTHSLEVGNRPAACILEAEELQIHVPLNLIKIIQNIRAITIFINVHIEAVSYKISRVIM